MKTRYNHFSPDKTDTLYPLVILIIIFGLGFVLAAATAGALALFSLVYLSLPLIQAAAWAAVIAGFSGVLAFIAWILALTAS